jgi:hypothetical protein
MMMDDCFQGNLHNLGSLNHCALMSIHYAIGLINARIFRGKVAPCLQLNQLC